MSYEAKLDYYQRYIEPELIDEDERQAAKEQANLQSLAENIPPKMENECNIRKVVEVNESS